MNFELQNKLNGSINPLLWNEYLPLMRFIVIAHDVSEKTPAPLRNGMGGCM